MAAAASPFPAQCSDTAQLESGVKDNCCPQAGGFALSKHPEMLLPTSPLCFQGLRFSFSCFFLQKFRIQLFLIKNTDDNRSTTVARLTANPLAQQIQTW